MKIYHFYLAYICICALGVFPANSKAVPWIITNTEKSNLVFIMTDQWRGQALGFLDIGAVITPHLDALVRESYVFTQTVANYSACSPSLAMMLIGFLPFKNRVYSNGYGAICHSTYS